MYDCHYLSNLVGLVRAWDFEGVIAWVIMCIPYSASASCVKFAVVITGSVGVCGDALVSHIELVSKVTASW